MREDALEASRRLVLEPGEFVDPAVLISRLTPAEALAGGAHRCVARSARCQRGRARTRRWQSRARSSARARARPAAPASHAAPAAPRGTGRCPPLAPVSRTRQRGRAHAASRRGGLRAARGRCRRRGDTPRARCARTASWSSGSRADSSGRSKKPTCSGSRLTVGGSGSVKASRRQARGRADRVRGLSRRAPAGAFQHVHHAEEPDRVASRDDGGRRRRTISFGGQPGPRGARRRRRRRTRRCRRGSIPRGRSPPRCSARSRRAATQAVWQARAARHEQRDGVRTWW